MKVALVSIIGLPLVLVLALVSCMGPSAQMQQIESYNCGDLALPAQAFMQNPQAPGYSLKTIQNAQLIANAAEGHETATVKDQITLLAIAVDRGFIAISNDGLIGSGQWQPKQQESWGLPPGFADAEILEDPLAVTNLLYEKILTVPNRNDLKIETVAAEIVPVVDPLKISQSVNSAMLLAANIFNVVNIQNCLIETDPMINNPSGSLWAPPVGKPVVITSQYGYRTHPVYGDQRLHAGTDFRAPCGTQIFASSGGRITKAGPLGGLGNAIKIDHGAGVGTTYGHLQNGGVLVSLNQTVVPGQLIGLSGTTGTSTACHLHFEVAVSGKTVNPMPFLQTQGVEF